MVYAQLTVSFLGPSFRRRYCWLRGPSVWSAGPDGLIASPDLESLEAQLGEVILLSHAADKEIPVPDRQINSQICLYG